MSAYTKNGFKRKFGYLPEELNHKPVELHDEHGDKWYAFLVSECDEEKREVDIWFSKNDQVTDFTQLPTTTSYDDQSKRVFQHQSTEPKAQMLRKLAKVVPLSTVMAKAAEMRSADGFGDDDAESQGGDQRAPYALQRMLMEGGRRVEPQSPTRSAPATPPALLAEFASPGAPGQRASSVRSAGSSAMEMSIARSGAIPQDLCSMRSSMASGSKALGPARTVEEHIARLIPGPILAGTNTPRSVGGHIASFRSIRMIRRSACWRPT